MFKRKGRGGIPDRWEDYTNMGHQIPGTRFIAFKTPLRECLMNSLESSQNYFDIRCLIDHCSGLGLVIDLTNTNKYYNPQEFQEFGIKHQKLKTMGHAIPSANLVNKFAKIVEDFLEKNERNDRLIGVHCTHGVNRTGYMICNYMIRQLGVPPDQAIADFNSARGHELERLNYLNHLRRVSWSQDDSLNENDLSFSKEGDAGNSTTSPNYTPPPYMPYQFRKSRSRSNNFRNNDDDDDQFGTNKTRDRSRSRSFYKDRGYGWSPYGAHGPPRWKSQQSNEQQYSGSFAMSQNAQQSTSYAEERSPHQRSAKRSAAGKRYYQEYYHGQVSHQYDRDFYNRRGGGIGPHRPPPRNEHAITGDGKRPRQYRGPRPYRSPKVVEALPSYEGMAATPMTTRGRKSLEQSQTPKFAEVDGPARNPLSPGTEQVFSPENEYRRRKSWRRYQPY